VKILGWPGPGPDDVERIDQMATAALRAGAVGDEKTWLDAVRKAQPRFDWSAQPIVKAQYSLWLDRTWGAAIKRSFDENTRVWRYARDSALARRSLQVYQQEGLREMLQTEQDLKLIERFQVFSDAEWRLQGAGCLSHGNVCLAFRGTNSLRNWKLNLRAGVSEPGVHGGFWSAWRRLETQVRAWLASLPQKSGKLTVTGHSLGGAIAILAAFGLHEEYEIERVVTFGSPRLAKPRFADMYAQAGLSGVTRRYIHATDLVSSIVPEKLYMHVGDGFFITVGGAIAENAPEPTFNRLHRGFQDSLALGAKAVAEPFMNPLVTPLGTIGPKSWVRGSLAFCRQIFVEAVASHPAYILPVAAGLGGLFGSAYVAARSVSRIRALWIDIGEHDMKKYQSAFEHLSSKWLGNLKLDSIGKRFLPEG